MARPLSDCWTRQFAAPIIPWARHAAGPARGVSHHLLHGPGQCDQPPAQRRRRPQRPALDHPRHAHGNDWWRCGFGKLLGAGAGFRRALPDQRAGAGECAHGTRCSRSDDDRRRQLQHRDYRGTVGFSRRGPHVYFPARRWARTSWPLTWWPNCSM